MTVVGTQGEAAAREAEWLERFRAGDRRVFDDIVRAHRRELYRVARRILGSHEDADEAAQEAFVRAWRSLARFRGEASLRTWLIRIVLNVARTQRARRAPTTPLEEAGAVAAGGERAEERVRRREVRRRVRDAVSQLPPRQREVVALKVFSELTYRDVAHVMGLSEGAVKAHLHQAVANLRRRMG
jgi:RNA polymerase sigma-70 factor (ECF subfamily)